MQGDKRLGVTTDEQGAFRFADLADGTWTIEVRMLGFETTAREVGVAASAPAPAFEMQFLSEQALLASLNLPAAPETPQRADQPFRTVDVNQSADTNVLAAEGTIKAEEVADLTQNAANSFLVHGSMSSAAGLPQQNDWAADRKPALHNEPP